MMRRKTTKLYGRTRARKTASKPSWSAVKKEYGIARTVYKTFAAIPLSIGVYENPSWNTNPDLTTHAMAVKFGTIGILTSSNKFNYFKHQFDEFRIAAIQYTFTATNRHTNNVDNNYWPQAFQTMITSYDRNAPLPEEYISMAPMPVELQLPNVKQNIPGLINEMLAEPSCTIKTVSSGNQLQQTVTLTPNSKQHYNWISTQFNTVTEGGIAVYAQLLNQIFNPQVKVAVLSDSLNDIGQKQYLAVQIEIRIECRGAKLGQGMAQ